MASPCTLLAQPQFQRYYDALGSHPMLWHEKAFTKRRMSHLPGTNTINYPEERWAYFARGTLEALSVELVNAVTPFNTNTQNMWTATNATKTNVFDTTLATWLETNFAAINDQQFWEVLGLNYAHGSGHAGSAFFEKLVSTGGDVTLTTLANAGPADFDESNALATAMVVNASANDRVFKLIANGVEASICTPAIVPAKTYMHLRGFLPGFTAGQAVGIKIKDTVAAEEFYLIQFGAVQWITGDPMGPLVHTTTSDVPKTLYYDPNNLQPITTWSGTAFESQGRAGETFWRVPITAAHIPDDQHFTVVSRNHPMYLPFAHSSYYWSILRFPEGYATAADGGVNVVVRQTSPNPNDLTAGSQMSLSVLAGDATVQASVLMGGLPNPVRQIEPFTCGIEFNDDEVRIRQGDVISPWTPMAQETFPGWMSIGSPLFSDLLLVPGAGSNSATGSFGMSRDHAIFNRPLSDNEWDYLMDPDSIWYLGMFDTPQSATVVGFEGAIYRGDTQRATITIFGSNAAPIPLYGMTVWFTLKMASDTTSDDSNAVLACIAEVLPDGSLGPDSQNVFEYNPEEGTVGIRLTLLSGAQNYDVQVKNIDGDIQTLLTGSIAPIDDVTKDI